MNGKGDRPRPMEISRQQWEANWDACFGTHKEPDSEGTDDEALERTHRPAKARRSKRCHSLTP